MEPISLICCQRNREIFPTLGTHHALSYSYESAVRTKNDFVSFRTLTLFLEYSRYLMKAWLGI